MELSPHLFWDIDPSQLDYEKNARFIIERVVTRGHLSDWDEIIRYYGEEGVKREIVRIRSLDIKTLAFLSSFFKIAKESFQCYTNLSSGPQPFPF